MNVKDSEPRYLVDDDATECLTFDSLYPETMVFCVTKDDGHENLRIKKNFFSILSTNKC